MKQIDVPVQFTGVVGVLVPGHLTDHDAKLLAEKVALARILATYDNPDAPEEDACDDYAEKCSDTAHSTAEQDWDRCKIYSFGGEWAVNG